MKSYRQVLNRFVTTDFGGGALEQSDTADQTLREDLRSVIRSDEKYFNLCVGVVLILFAGSAVVTVMNLHNLSYIVAIFSATGVSYVFLLKQMISLWREKSKAEIGYHLASKLPPQDLKSVVMVLLSEPK